MEAPMIGTTVSHYIILEQLGKGGMGVVYKAQDLRLDRPVALKFLPPDLTRDPEAKQRFIHEAKAASALQHTNICVVHDIDETNDGQMFISMEYLEGETLKKKIERGPFRIIEAVDIAIQVAQGLAKAHEHAIIHRDIKPANIMITNDGVAKVVDFGLAKLSGTTMLTRMGATLGTIAYMSPEQTKGEVVDSRTDIWSLGVTLYEMIAGQRPFTSDYEQGLIYLILNEEPAPLHQVRPDVPEALEAAVRRAIAKRPSDRFASVPDFIADLEAYIPGTTLSNETAKRPSRNIRVLVASAAALAVFVVVGYFTLAPLWEEQVLASNPIPIAVISFENQTGDTTFNFLRRGIPELIITNLERSKYLQVMTWDRLRSLTRQVGKGNVEVIDADLGLELCRREGVRAMIRGSLMRTGDLFAVDAKVIDVQSMKSLASASSKGRGPESILETQIEALSKQIARGVGLSSRVVDSTPMRIADVSTSNWEAYRWYIRALEAYDRLLLADVCRHLRRAVELDTTFVTAYLSLRGALLSQSKMKEANEALAIAKRHSDKATERERLVLLAIDNPDTAEVRRLNRLRIERFGMNKEDYLWQALQRERHDEFEQAIASGRKALELDPFYGRALANLGYIYLDAGRHDSALQCFRRYSSFYPGEANPADCLGDFFFRQGKLAEAAVNYKRAVNIRPDCASRLMLSYLDAMQEKYADADLWIDQALANDTASSQQVNYLWWKAFLQFWAGEFDRSLVSLRGVDTLAGSIQADFIKVRANWLRADRRS